MGRRQVRPPQQAIPIVVLVAVVVVGSQVIPIVVVAP